MKKVVKHADVNKIQYILRPRNKQCYSNLCFRRLFISNCPRLSVINRKLILLCLLCRSAVNSALLLYSTLLYCTLLCCILLNFLKPVLIHPKEASFNEWCSTLSVVRNSRVDFSTMLVQKPYFQAMYFLQ